MPLFRTASPKGRPSGALFCCVRQGTGHPIARRGQVARRLHKAGLAFIFSAILAYAVTLHATNTPPAHCTADHIDEHVTVERLYDGDTVKLSDGRRVRFIGINTPEIGHRGASPQPLAGTARDMLQALLEQSRHTIGLRYDAEHQDRYGRDLAHVYLRDGSSVEARLLEHGLATIMPVPPNLWNLACYQAVEQRARKARRGIWALPEYQPVAAIQLRQHDTGMRLIKGKVTASRLLKGDIWLTLDDTLLLHIGRRDRSHFPATFPAGVSGHTVIARGRLYFAEGALRMQIRHPATLEMAQ